jgi:hypothetical protein
LHRRSRRNLETHRGSARTVTSTVDAQTITVSRAQPHHWKVDRARTAHVYAEDPVRRCVHWGNKSEVTSGVSSRPVQPRSTTMLRYCPHQANRNASFAHIAGIRPGRVEHADDGEHCRA